MELALIGVVGIVLLVGVSLFSKQLGVAAPLVLVVVGSALAFVPGLPDIRIRPEVILEGVLPVLLYAAAIQVPLTDFRRNLGSIGVLSVGLVLASSLLTGLVIFALFPQLALAPAIALGAIISPTDAVAATSIGKRLGLPDRLVAVLEGESLVNDATALVLLRSALAAAVAGTFSFGEAAGNFAFAVVVALVLGYVVGAISVWVRSKLHDSMLDTALSFVVPFVAYIPAEALGASGVLAVVVAGLYAGHQGARHFPPQSRLSERLNWRTLQFLFENGVFLVMGLQLPVLVGDVREADLGVDRAILYGLIVTAVLIAVRFLFVGPLVLRLRATESREEENIARLNGRLQPWRDDQPAVPAQQRRMKQAEKRIAQYTIDMTQLRREPLGWRGGLILGWSGMRGVVTLAAAQSLPESIPYRSQLILMAFVVAIFTLLVQGGTLPLLIRWTGVRGSDKEADLRSLADLYDELEQAGRAVLDNEAGARRTNDRAAPADPATVDRLRSLLARQTEIARRQAGGPSSDTAPETPSGQFRRLWQDVVDAERAALFDARGRGAYSSRVIRQAQAQLDAQLTRLEEREGE